MVKNLFDLLNLAKQQKKRKLVLAAAHDQNALEAVLNAMNKGIVDVQFLGNQEKIFQILDQLGFDNSGISIIHEPDNEKAASIAVKMVRDKHADILMKGHLSTSTLLRAILNKEWGLRSGELLSHLALFEMPSYHKILGLTDAAMNIQPDLKAKISIIQNSVFFLNKLGLETPKVALLSAVETVNPDLKSTTEAALLAKMNDRGQISNCLLDGPFALDNAISKKSAQLKGISSPVAGDADLLVGDDLDMSNALYKSFIYFGQAKCAAVIVGAAAPVVLTSRADSDETKLLSIALAAAVN